jgi:peptidoglycan/LPS O-acetylase OafA/YrhL
VRAPSLSATGMALVAYVASLPTSELWFYFAAPPRFSQLLAGCAIALLLQDLGSRARPSRRSAEILGWASLRLIAVWTVVGPGQYTSAYRLAGLPLITLASVCLCLLPSWSRHTAVERVLQLRPLVLVGLASYSLSPWHLLALQTLTPGRFGLSFIGLAAVGVGFTAVATTLSYRLLEVPRFRRSSRVHS